MFRLHFQPAPHAKNGEESLGLMPVKGSLHIETPVFHTLLFYLVLLLCLGLHPEARGEQRPASPSTAPLTCDRVVDNLIAMNLKRAQALRGYTAKEIYQLQYQGFPSSRTAGMLVDVSYRAPATKSFVVQSTTGSQTLIDRVFKRLNRAQQEAQGEAAQKNSALNRENYDFAMIGYQKTPSGSTYVLSVKPRTKGRFLYSGQIWIDSVDFAVTRLKATPAKSPSCWIKHSEIDESYGKVDGFWLPARSTSISSIRFGGKAEMTIDFQDYKITRAVALDSADR